MKTRVISFEYKGETRHNVEEFIKHSWRFFSGPHSWEDADEIAHLRSAGSHGPKKVLCQYENGTVID